MKKAKTIIYFSTLIILLPVLGFPSGWDTVITLIASFVILLVGFVYYRRERNVVEKREKTKKINFPETPVFVESKTPAENIETLKDNNSADTDEKVS